LLPIEGLSLLSACPEVVTLKAASVHLNGRLFDSEDGGAGGLPPEFQTIGRGCCGRACAGRCSDAAAQALLAHAPLAVMLAYLRSPAFLAPALDALVGADARPQAHLALAPAAVMLAYARPQALLALAPAAVMLAYLRSPAFLAPALDALVGADARHSLHWLLQSCSHICEPTRGQWRAFLPAG
jgi:hypothetical protein